jgi:hypothetical protein
MPRAMVQNEATDQLSLRGRTVLHFHNFDHVKIDRFPPLVLGVCESPSDTLFSTMENNQVNRVPLDGGGGRMVITASTTDSES